MRGGMNFNGGVLSSFTIETTLGLKPNEAQVCQKICSLVLIGVLTTAPDRTCHRMLKNAGIERTHL